MGGKHGVILHNYMLSLLLAESDEMSHGRRVRFSSISLSPAQLLLNSFEWFIILSADFSKRQCFADFCI